MEKNSSIKEDKPLKLCLIGATGKVGTALAEMASLNPLFEITERVSQSTSIKQDLEADILIDFSTPLGTELALSYKKPLVCGTTNLSPQLIKGLYNHALEVPVLYSTNFSLSVALYFEMIEQVRPHLSRFSQVHIQETHHIHKKDAPSGTALQLAQLLKIDKEAIKVERKEQTGSKHLCSFLSSEEEIHLQHEAFSRKPYAEGALLAALFLFNKPAGYYTFKEVLKGCLDL